MSAPRFDQTRAGGGTAQMGASPPPQIGAAHLHTPPLTSIIYLTARNRKNGTLTMELFGGAFLRYTILCVSAMRLSLEVYHDYTEIQTP